MEEREAHRLLELVVAVDLDVGALPEVVEVLALVVEQAVEAGAPRRRERGVDLVADRDHRALAGPPVGQDLVSVSVSPWPTSALTVTRARSSKLSFSVTVPSRPVDHVVHRRRHPQGALPRAVHEHARAARGCRATRRRAAQRRIAAARGSSLRAGTSSLATSSDCSDDPRLAVERLDLVADRGHRAVHEGHQAHRAHLDLAPRRRAPVDLAAQHPGAQVERAAVRDQRAVAHVEGLVVDQQADELAVGDVDDGLAVLRVAVAGLRVGQRAHLVEGVQVGPGHARTARPRRGWRAARCGRWRARGPTRPGRACRGRAAPR